MASLLCVQHITENGTALFEELCEQDLESIVAKWSQIRLNRVGSPYNDSRRDGPLQMTDST